jgi:hypothetical protein
VGLGKVSCACARACGQRQRSFTVAFSWTRQTTDQCVCHVCLGAPFIVPGEGFTSGVIDKLVCLVFLKQHIHRCNCLLAQKLFISLSLWVCWQMVYFYLYKKIIILSWSLFSNGVAYIETLLYKMEYSKRGTALRMLFHTTQSDGSRPNL